MWVGNQDLPQRKRRTVKRDSSTDNEGNDIETTNFHQEDTQDAAELNPALRFSAEPGCSYECKHETYPSKILCLQAARIISLTIQSIPELCKYVAQTWTTQQTSRSMRVSSFLRQAVIDIMILSARASTRPLWANVPLLLFNCSHL